MERQTRNKIKDLIPEGQVSSATRLVLTNAIYFKAAWDQAFKAEATRPETFHLLDGKTIETPMMQATQEIRFAGLKALSLVELHYQGNQFSMIVVLPKKVDGLGELEKELTADNLKAWLAKLSAHEVDLKLPKFKMTAEFRLNDMLKQMGMQGAFDPDKADFSGMATHERLFISAVLHKAFIDVNEKETEAAAATAVTITAKALVEPPQRAIFHADHLFVFLIRDLASGSILFLGRVTNPGAK